jgi:hypothetical protein
MSDSIHSEDTAAALAEFRKEKDDLVAETISRRMESNAEFEHLGGKANDIMVAGFGFLNRMLETVLEFDEFAIMEHQLEWSENRLPHDGVSGLMLLNNLRAYRQVVEERLSPTGGREVMRVLDRIVARLEDSNRGQNVSD